jgi:hypothetical protein
VSLFIVNISPNPGEIKKTEMLRVVSYWMQLLIYNNHLFIPFRNDQVLTTHHLLQAQLQVSE